MEDKKQSAHKQAKLSLLKDLRRMAMGMIHEGSGEEMPAHLEIDAKDKPSLAHGLDTAKEMLKKGVGDDMFGKQDSPEEEASESPEEAAAEGDDMESPSEDHPEVSAAKEHLKALLAKHKK